jgi:hypothetical protein
MNRNEYKATPVKDLHLPTQSEVASNPDSPVAKTAAAKAHEKRWGAEPINDTATKDTGFRRGIPGCDC